MNRLTERDVLTNADIIGVKSTSLYNNLDFDETLKLTIALNKLARLEDIEEELGIYLHILFMALKNGIYVIESNDGYIVEDCICSIEHFKDGWGIVTNNEELELMMSDYDKTWALTRKELEDIE